MIIQCALLLVTVLHTRIALADSAHGSAPYPTAVQQNWILNCQGCHRPDATGSSHTTPVMTGELGKFLSVRGGREYLVRVPGVASSPLSDAELADLLNWTLKTYDAKHLPAHFIPYNATEIARLRQKPYRLDIAKIRNQLIAQFSQQP